MSPVWAAAGEYMYVQGPVQLFPCPSLVTDLWRDDPTCHKQKHLEEQALHFTLAAQ